MSFRNPEVLRYLRCARCRQGLTLRQIVPAAQTNETKTEAVSPVQEFLLCTNADCRLEFSIREEIPVLVTEFARELPFDQWQTCLNDRPCLNDRHSAAPSSENAPAAG